MNNYKIGDIIKTTVTGIKDYGVFVRINDYYSGLIHISEVSEEFVRDINDYVTIGEEIYAQIVSINENEKNFRLSIKNLDYRNDGSIINKKKELENGFEPLQEHLNYWIDEKIKEIMQNF